MAAVTNAQASRELDRSEYEVTGSITNLNPDLDNQLVVGNWQNLNTVISVNIPDATNVNPGDTISFEATNGLLIKTGDVYDDNGILLGKVAVDNELSGANLQEWYSDPASLSYDARWENLTPENPSIDRNYTFTFSENVANLDSLSFELSRNFVYRVAAFDLSAKGTTFESAILVNGVELDKNVFINTAYDYIDVQDHGGNVSNLYIGDDSVDFALRINGDNYKAGDIITYDLTKDPNYTFAPKDSVVVGEIVEMKDVSTDLFVKDIAFTNEHGAYGTELLNYRYRVISANSNEIKVEILDDAPLISIWAVPLDISYTGELIDGRYPAPVIGISGRSATGEEYYSYDDATTVFDQRTSSEGSSALAPKYTSTLNAVLEDGTVIKQ